ncbi:TonB-dependent receptor [Niabella sp. CC-SYL272]|uniref:TonB-dependent receptor n=1 Tax=Niabella agricola TaxID=2891571 RepID=UPI001F260350|nr:TonB-dependent receptor [Niabella agricola]MCF3111461.1 TonB-dependent receptor [Niabella agricola]
MRRFLLFLVTLMALLNVHAQTHTGNIEGVITTPEGNPVPNVNITIKGKKKHAVTNEKGYFEFTEIPYGDYILIYSFEGETSQEVPVTVPPVSSEASKYNLSLNARELKEVIVRIGGSINQGTARIGKSNIPIMDLPQAVTIIGQSTIENQQAQRLSDVIKNVNGMYLGTTRGNTQETFYARGYNLGSTNTFKNGFRVNSGAMPEMSAIESVEVLKGGTALLYGNVAPGGIVNMVTKKPRFNFGGEVNMRVGSYDLYKPSIDIYGPVSKSVAYRLNGTYEKANSYRDGVHSERYYVNPSLLFKLSEKTKLLVQGDYLQHEFIPDFGIGTLTDKANVFTDGKTIAPVGRNAFFGAPWQYAKTNQATASAELSHTFNDNWQLSALAGYQNYERDYFSLERVQADVNGKWRRPLGKTNNKQDYFTGQVNVNGQFQTGSIGHKVLIGMDGERDITTNLASTYTASSFYDTISLTDPAAYVARTDMPTDWKWRTSVKNPVSRFGAYLQDLVTLSDKFKLLAGVRWSLQQIDAPVTDSLLNGKTAKGRSQVDRAFSPRVGLVYQPTMHTSVFASYSSSFTPNSGQDIDGKTLKPSFIDQYELGVKNDFFEGLLSANLTLYRIVNSNLSQPSQVNPQARELTGQTTSDGIEVDLKSQPIKGWDILAGYSYNNMRYTSTSGKSGSYVEGQRLVNTPAHTANATTFYTFPKGPVKGLKLGAGVYYTGERNAGWNNDYKDDNGSIRDRLFTVKGFVTADLSAGYTYRQWSLLAKLSNISNTFNYYVHENYSVNPIPPRSFVVTAAFKF